MNYYIIAALIITNLGTIAYFLLKKKSQPKVNSRELDEYLLDQLRGGGLIRVQRVNPEDVFLRSPRAR